MVRYAAIEQRCFTGGAFALLFYQGEGMICASRAVQGVCVRALAMSGDTLFRFFEQFEKLL